MLVARLIRPPSADGRTARRAPARNFSTSRAASAHRSQKNRWPAAQNLYIPPQKLYIPPPPAAGLYIQLCIFLASPFRGGDYSSVFRWVCRFDNKSRRRTTSTESEIDQIPTQDRREITWSSVVIPRLVLPALAMAAHGLELPSVSLNIARFSFFALLRH